MCLDERTTDGAGRRPPERRSFSGTLRLRRAFVPLPFARPGSVLLLAFLAEDEFANILHALALVGLRRTIGANLGGDLADALNVAARHRDLGRLRHGDRDPFRDRVDHIVAVAERELQVLALQRGAVTDAGDFELLLETVGDTLDQIRDLGEIGRAS